MQISHTMIPVNDVDGALDFYVDKVGFEKVADVPFPGGRWLTVRAPGQELELVLVSTDMGPQSDEVKQRLRDLVALGAVPAAILRVDDCRAAYERLRERGVEFTEAPEDRFYGVDAGFRDPSGNPWRLTQPHSDEVVAERLAAAQA